MPIVVRGKRKSGDTREAVKTRIGWRISLRVIVSCAVGEEGAGQQSGGYRASYTCSRTLHIVALDSVQPKIV